MKKRRKHSISVITAAVISMISIFTPLTNALPVGGVMAMADEPDNNSGNGVANTISSGQVDVGDDKVINWTINTENNTLTFKGEGAIPDYAYNDRKPWGEQFLSGPDTNYIPLEKVKKVVIDKGITRVGEHAFNSFGKVTEVELPESLTEIGNDAFNGCKALTSITIPEKVETIGADAFYMCSALSKITLSNNLTHIGKTAFCSTGLESVTLPSSLTSMGESVFSNCEALKTVSFNENCKLEELPVATFSHCTALSLVELPKNLKTIGKYAFYECGALKGIDLPDTLEEIGENAFNTSGLVSLEIPSNVQKLGRDSFGSCAGLKRVALGDNITERGNGVFSGCSDPEKYMLYSGTKEEFQNKLSGLNAVANSTDFTVIYNYKKGVVNASIEAGSGIGKATIKWDKYYDIDPAKDSAGYKIEMKNENGEWIDVPNDQITDNELDSEIKKLEPGKEYIFKVLAFYNEQMVSKKTAESGELSITPSNVIKSGTIGENNNITWEISPAEESGKFILTISGEGDMPDFSDNSGQPWKNWSYNGDICSSDSISQIIIKDGITGIGDSTFLSLKGVTEVTLPEGLKTIGSKAFGSCKELGSLILPESLKTIGSYAFRSCEKLSSLTLKEGLESIDEFAFSETALTSISIPGSVKAIGRYAFAFNEKLDTVGLKEGLETIDTCAFQQCPIKDITIPASVKEIGTAEGSPFCACPELVSIRVAGNNSYVRVIDGVLFSKDGKTLIQYPAGREESTYTVPSGTEKIAPYAFAGCMKLKNILIPEGVKSIGNFAFMGNEMESVNIPDSATELGLFLFAQSSAGKVILPKNLDKDHLMPFLFMAAEVKDVYFPGSKEEWQALEDSFRSISDEGKLEILKTMLPIMGGEWKEPETEEAKQDLIGMYDRLFGSLTLLDYMDENTGELLSANLICDYREDLSGKGYEIDNIPEQTYQGSPVKPAVTVRNEEGVLYPGCYVTEFKDNNKAGTATVTVKGTGRYSLSGNGAYGLYLTKNFTIKEQATVPTDPADDTPVLPPSDNKPMDIRTETVGDGSGGEFKVEYAHQIPFFGKGKITPALFGDKFTVLHGNTAYKVTKIKVNKKKKRIQITGLEGADKATVKAIKKATKGDKGMSFEENPYYVKDTDTVIAKFKKNGNLKSVKITINNKGYKAKKDEFEYDKAEELIRFKGANLDGSYKVSTHN